MRLKSTTGNQELLKKNNMEHIIRAILMNAPISRIKLASLTSLNKMTISNIVDQFLKKNIVCEIGTVNTLRGRPPTLIEVNKNLGYYVGIDVDFNQFQILLTDLSGQKIKYEQYPMKKKDPAYFVSKINDILLQYQNIFSNTMYGILGIGIAIPGYYNDKKNIVEYTTSLREWNGFHLYEELKSGNPDSEIVITSSSHAGVAGEIYHSHLKETDDLVYVAGSWGLSVGICNDGMILAGSSGTAGRLGHSTIFADGRQCSCGNNGCWEMYASVKALYNALDIQQAQFPFHKIIQLIENGEPAYIQAVRELGYYQGIGLANVVNAYNPKFICIGGPLALLKNKLIDSIWISLKERLPDHFLRGFEIYASKLGDSGIAYGAVSLVVNQVSQKLVKLALQ